MIPNVANIAEDSGIKHFTGQHQTNVAKVRLPMVKPAIEKYVEADGDDSGQNHAIDQNAEQNMIMDKDLEHAQRVLEEVQKLSNIPEDVQKVMDKLVETVAEVSSTADDIIILLQHKASKSTAGNPSLLELCKNISDFSIQIYGFLFLPTKNTTFSNPNTFIFSSNLSLCSPSPTIYNFSLTPSLFKSAKASINVSKSFG